MQVLVHELRRTNRLLQAVIYGGVGFVLGIIAARLAVHLPIF